MTLAISENVRWYALVVGLTAVLAVLAALQYRSSKQVSDATTEQMRISLQGSLMDLRQGLERELRPLCRELQTQSGFPRQSSTQEYLSRFERWRRAAAHPSLVTDFFIWRAVDTEHPQLIRMNSNGKEFEATNWPSELEPLRRRFQDSALTLKSGRAIYGRSDQPQVSPPGLVTGNLPADPPAPPSFPWMIDQNVPALVHPVLESDSGRQPETLSWIVIKLNLEVFRRDIFPELAERYFRSNNHPTYDLAVVAENANGAVIYSSDDAFGNQKDVVSDAALNLFGRPVPIARGPQSSSDRTFGPYTASHGERPAAGAYAVRPLPGFHDEGFFRIEPIHYTTDEQDWEIIARHRKGSVEAAVTTLYRRNLTINFGVLLVLATTIGLIIATSRRAQRLAQLQMDFVASVSHELRTPLTGIVSASQNIADGLIDNKERILRYGEAIMGQAQQLSDLVEQILLFSATQKDRHRYHLQRVDVVEVIDASLKGTSSIIRSAGFTVEEAIQLELPPVMVDFKALSQCLQNLIANSVKYGGDSRWIGIRAALADQSGGVKEVRISIEDKGIGIGREDLGRIFEPFYRSPAATAAQIHGSGLGLALARNIAEAMGGRLTVRSVPQKGSTFTVHLPVKDDAETASHLSMTPEVNSIS